MASRPSDPNGIGRVLKRGLDVVIGTVLLVVLSPILIVLATAVVIDSGRPAFFRQERLGMHGRVFRIYKFRTMGLGAESTGSGVRTSIGDPRITYIGGWLRSTSLDELPQLLNVVLGDMSLVGPRPPVTYHPYEFEDYPQKYGSRFDVRPGMTGLAQTSGRNQLNWEQRLSLDVQYVDSWSLLLDLRILAETVRVVLTRAGSVIEPPDDTAGRV